MEDWFSKTNRLNRTALRLAFGLNSYTCMTEFVPYNKYIITLSPLFNLKIFLTPLEYIVNLFIES